MKSTLIIHPLDVSTRFLCSLYKTIPNKTVITGGVTKNELRKEIQAHSHLILCGHGSSSGLLSAGQFPEGPYIIEASMVSVLTHKTTALFIWCYANSFVRKHNLSGFFTGLFLSETIECLSVGMEDFTEEDINESNYGFAEIVARHLVDEPDRKSTRLNSSH